MENLYWRTVGPGHNTCFIKIPCYKVNIENVNNARVIKKKRKTTIKYKLVLGPF